MIRNPVVSFVFFVISVVTAPALYALDVKLSPDRDFVEVIHQNRLVKVQRIQDQKHILEGGFAKTSRKCPPFCIQPMSAGAGVETVGQLEVFDFMENELLDEEGLIIDARTPAWWERGTIPGSINIPFKVFTLEPDDPKLLNAMRTLGAKPRGQVGGFTRAIEGMGMMGGDLKTDEWDFTSAKKVLVWCNGIWCGQSPRAIAGLLRLGYPVEKILYYRGGMQVWQSLGLTVVVPE